MSITTVAAGISNHLRGKRDWAHMRDIAAAHKTGLDHLLTYYVPNNKQLHHVALREIESDPKRLIFDCAYAILDSDRNVTDTISLRITVTPTFGSWIDIDIDGGVLPAGGKDRARIRDEFLLALMEPVEWDGVRHTYKRVL